MISLEKNFASIVVYCKNNQPLVEPFVSRVGRYFSSKFESFEIVFVDDCSVDNSAVTALNAAKSLERGSLTVVNLSYPQGKETGMSAGVDMSIGDFVFEFESIALDFPDELLDSIYQKCLSGFDIVAGTPKGKRHIQNEAFFSLFNRGRGPLIPIETESVRILSRRAINRIGMVSGKTVYRKAVYYGCGLKMHRIEYTPVLDAQPLPPRPIGEEVSLAIDSLLYFTNLGFRFAIGLSIAMMLFSVSGVVYAGMVYFFRNYVVEGWLTTMLFLSFGFFGVFSIFAISIKYLSLILAATHRKQAYVFESVAKSNRN